MSTGVGLSYKGAVAIVESEWYNALYFDGHLDQQGKPEYLNAETLARVYTTADRYYVPNDVYDDCLNGAGYPDALADFPLNRCQKIT